MDSEIRNCSFLNKTLPRSSPITLARNLPFIVIKVNDIPISAHFPIREGLAPVNPNPTMPSILCKGTRLTVLSSFVITTFSPSNDKYDFGVVM